MPFASPTPRRRDPPCGSVLKRRTPPSHGAWISFYSATAGSRPPQFYPAALCSIARDSYPTGVPSGRPITTESWPSSTSFPSTAHTRPATRIVHPVSGLTRIIHEYLLQQPIPSPDAAFLVRSPRRTASPPVSPLLARSHDRLRSQPLRDDIHESSGLRNVVLCRTRAN